MQDIASLLYKIKVVDEKITRIFEKQLGISLTRYQILNDLLEAAPCSQQFLQEKMEIDRAAIARHLKILEESGYVTRYRKQDNQREMVVLPSQKAIQDMQLDPPAHHLEIKAAMENILSNEEEGTLLTLLEKLLLGLDRLPIAAINTNKGG